jgi:transposase
MIRREKRAMAGFVEGVDRGQSTLFPVVLDDYVAEDNPVRAVDVFVDGLDLDKLGFVGVEPLDTGRPGYHPGTMLKLYIMATSIACRRAGGWSGSASAISK